ncbi:MAG: UDP-N-acetylmuramyl peptide synthase [Sulfobacillus benefaciens]|uniref:UDP-N-acetylmuramyl peptide synthase n=1 Tax=Sulfobacillus benefaciens TaxID=453960 RepID=A0A2T2XE17_9FIRM|nr:MAG: UDP-N-acetylmuramyl peptide synthase [Sulfobacillus benefaciens]
MPCSLAALFDGILCQGLLPQYRQIVIDGIASDSRQVTPNTVFVALPGQSTDGLLFVSDAIARGAVAIISAQPSDPAGKRSQQNIPWIHVSNPRALLPTLAQRAYGFPAKQLRLHGITGTNGKTTTAYMLASILSQAGHRVAFWTTNSVEGIDKPFRPSMTTPDAPQLHRFLRETLDHGAQDVIIEVSSHALELGRIEGLQFESIAITNITPDHIDFHGNFAAYVRAKASLLQYRAPHGIAVLNGDDPVVAAIAQASSDSVWRFGFDHTAEIQAQLLNLDVNGSSWHVNCFDQQLGPFRLSVPGRHNVMNAMAALGMAIHLGTPVQDILAALSNFVPPPRRLETVNIGDYTIITDVAMNPASYDTVMSTVRTLNRPVVVVNAIRGNRGPSVNRDIANVLADWNGRLHFAPVIASLSEDLVTRMAVDYRVRPEELMAFQDQARIRGLAVELYRNLPEAVDKALAYLPSGGVLLLLGTFGMDDGLRLVEARLKPASG